MASSRADSFPHWNPEADLEHLFGFAPFPLEQDPNADIPKPYSSPITFFDRHLDESLILKRVTILPSLISTLTDALDDYVSAFNSKNNSYHSSRLYLSPELYDCLEPPKNAADIGRRYCQGASPFLYAASVLVVHPEQPELSTVFMMDDRGTGSEEFHAEQYSLKYKAYTREDMLGRLESWDTDNQALLLSMWGCLPDLAIWDTYALSGRSILEDMAGLATLDVFPWKQCGVSGNRHFTSTVHVERPDVSKYLWEIAPRRPDGMARDSATGLRRSERLKSHPSSARKPPQFSTRKQAARSSLPKEPTTPKIAVPKSGRGTSRYKANTADFIQRVCFFLFHVKLCDNQV